MNVLSEWSSGSWIIQKVTRMSPMQLQIDIKRFYWSVTGCSYKSFTGSMSHSSQRSAPALGSRSGRVKRLYLERVEFGEKFHRELRCVFPKFCSIMLINKIAIPFGNLPHSDVLPPSHYCELDFIVTLV